MSRLRSSLANQQISRLGGKLRVRDPRKIVQFFDFMDKDVDVDVI